MVRNATKKRWIWRRANKKLSEQIRVQSSTLRGTLHQRLVRLVYITEKPRGTDTKNILIIDLMQAIYARRKFDQRSFDMKDPKIIVFNMLRNDGQSRMDSVLHSVQYADTLRPDAAESNAHEQNNQDESCGTVTHTPVANLASFTDLHACMMLTSVNIYNTFQRMRVKDAIKTMYNKFSQNVTSKRGQTAMSGVDNGNYRVEPPRSDKTRSRAKSNAFGKIDDRYRRRSKSYCEIYSYIVYKLRCRGQ